MLGTWFDDGLFERMERMRREMNQLMGAFRPFVGGGVFPAINIYDNGEAYIAQAELPGVDPREVDVTVTGNTLNVKGKREIQPAGDKAAYLRRERAAGEFNRAFKLPEAVDSGKVQAIFRNGILQVMMPRAEQAQARKVSIKAE